MADEPSGTFELGTDGPRNILVGVDGSVTSLRAGDRVVFGLAGAYAWNISHQDFLMHPRPTFHYV